MGASAGGGCSSGFLTVRVLAVNREIVVTDDVPGAFARKLSPPSSTAPAKSSTSRSRAARRPGPATNAWPLEGTHAVDWLVVNFFGRMSCVSRRSRRL